MKKIIILMVATALLLTACSTETTGGTVETTVATTEVPVSQELYNDNGVKIDFTGLNKKGGLLGPEVKMLIDNKSGKAITIQARDFSVNGFMIDPIMSEDVKDGKKENTEIDILQDYLDENGSTEIKEIELKITIIDSETFETITTSDNIKITIN